MMRFINKLLCCIAIMYVLVTIFSCNSNTLNDAFELTESDIIGTRTALLEDQYTTFEDKEFLYECGYDTTAMEVYDEWYIVEKRYKITKDVLLKDRALLQSNTFDNDKILSAHFQKIYFDVGTQDINCFSIMNNAVKMWNNVGSNLQFQTQQLLEDNTEQYPFSVRVVFTTQPLIGSDLINVELSSVVNREVLPKKIEVNIGHSKWKLLSSNPIQKDCLMAHVIGRIVGLSVIEPSEDNLGQYPTSDSIMTSYEFINKNNTQVWPYGITYSDAEQIREKFPIVAPVVFSYNWKPIPEVQNNIYYVLQNVDYTLTMPFPSCCNKDYPIAFCMEVKNNGSPARDVVMSRVGDALNMFRFRFERVGVYNITIWTQDNDVANLHKQSIEVRVCAKSFTLPVVDEMQLNTPYYVKYNYSHPDYPNAIVDYQLMGEVFFDKGNASNVHISVVNGGANVTLSQNGSYYIAAIVKDNGVPVDTAYCNLTKMVRLPNNIHMRKLNTYRSDITPYTTPFIDTVNPIIAQYHYQIGFPATTSVQGGRFGCLIQSISEKRNHFDYSELSDASRRVDRDWTTNYSVFTKAYYPSSSTLFDLPPLYWLQNATPNEDGFLRWCYEYYTGTVVCPLDGIYAVDSMRVQDLPMQSVSVSVQDAEPNEVTE